MFRDILLPRVVPDVFVYLIKNSNAVTTCRFVHYSITSLARWKLAIDDQCIATPYTPNQPSQNLEFCVGSELLWPRQCSAWGHIRTRGFLATFLNVSLGVAPLPVGLVVSEARREKANPRDDRRPQTIQNPFRKSWICSDDLPHSFDTAWTGKSCGHCWRWRRCYGCFQSE